MESLPENSIEAFIDEGLAQTELFNKLVEKQNILLHKVFVQNEDGAKLLAQWKEDLIMIPSVQPESTKFGAGLTEGGKMFVRNIITQINLVESTNE